MSIYRLTISPSGETINIPAGQVLVSNGDGTFSPGGGGGGAVSSVFTRIGAVVAALGDYSAQLISYAGSVAGATQVKAALDSLQAQISGLPSSPVTSVFTRVGAVVAALGDYSAQLISYAGDVAGATQVKAALDSLQAQISGLPAPRVIDQGTITVAQFTSVTVGPWTILAGETPSLVVWPEGLGGGDNANWDAADSNSTCTWSWTNDGFDPNTQTSGRFYNNGAGDKLFRYIVLGYS